MRITALILSLVLITTVSAPVLAFADQWVLWTTWRYPSRSQPSGELVRPWKVEGIHESRAECESDAKVREDVFKKLMEERDILSGSIATKCYPPGVDPSK